MFQGRPVLLSPLEREVLSPPQTHYETNAVRIIPIPGKGDTLEAHQDVLAGLEVK